MTVLHHLALGARDVEKVAAFYRDVLGLAEQARHAYPDGSLRSVWLDLGTATLMVEHAKEGPRDVPGIGAGLFLLCVAVAREERSAMEARLMAAGCVVEGRTEFSSYARDPEGNRVAISHHPLMKASNT